MTTRIGLSRRADTVLGSAIGRLGAIAGVLGFLIEAHPAQAQPVAYVAGDLWVESPPSLSSTRWFGRVDLATGDLTPIARIIDPDSTVFLPVDGMDFDPLTGRLWAVNGSEDLFELDPATGQVIGSILTLIDSVTGVQLNKVGYGLSFAPGGVLYISAGVSGPFLGTVDKTTGVVVQIVTGGTAPRPEGLAVAPSGAVFGTHETSPANRVHQADIDPITGAFSIIGLLGDPLNSAIGLDFDASGQLWGIERGAIGNLNSTVFRVDTATAARTPVWTPTDPVTGLQIRAEAIAIAPAVGVPSLRGPALLLLALALVGGALLAARPTVLRRA